MKTHYAVTKENEFGGYNSDTLCGRESGKVEEVNAEAEQVKVTCKLCQEILDNPKHWRHRKWLK